ncbi:hypothetical protein HMPREF3156_01445 [Neisseria sp. HMSC06F02]|nr:hypothetical protein HMPREF3156_01445 [Neisseria sp. HMSC06F02]
MSRGVLRASYSGLTLNQYGGASPCRTICTSAASSPCPDSNLIHYTYPTP